MKPNFGDATPPFQMVLAILAQPSPGDLWNMPSTYLALEVVGGPTDNYKVDYPGNQ